MDYSAPLAADLERTLELLRKYKPWKKPEKVAGKRRP